MNLAELLEEVQLTKKEDVKLYFVTRASKANVTKRTPAKDKYLFNVFQMDCNDEVRSYLYETTTKQISKILQKNYDIIDYDILTDETEHLFTYSIQNKVFSFNDVVTNQLLKASPKVTSLTALSETEEMWAYCVEFMNIENGKRIFTFRKILPSKIGVDEKAKNFIRAVFNTQSQQLALLKEETVNLDEQIVGLQEEFKEKAYEVADNMINSGYFIGGEKLKELIDKKPSIHKKLLKVEKLGGYKNISPKMLTSMKRVCKKYGETLPVQDDKLSIESEQNIDTILKALGDYYKIGEISGKPYGTFAGKELKTIN